MIFCRFLPYSHSFVFKQGEKPKTLPSNPEGSNKAPKSPGNVEKKVPSEAEKKALLDHYKQTHARLVEAKKKMETCRKILDQHPNDTKGQALYHQAKGLLYDVTKSVEAFRDHDVDFVEKLDKQAYKAFLVAHGFYAPDSFFDETYLSEPSPLKTLQNIQELQKLNFPHEEILRVFHYTSNRRGEFAELFPFFRRMQKSGISPKDSFDIWIYRPYYSNGHDKEITSMIGFVRDMQALGVNKNIARYYSPHDSARQQIYFDLAKRFHAAGILEIDGDLMDYCSLYPRYVSLICAHPEIVDHFHSDGLAIRDFFNDCSRNSVEPEKVIPLLGLLDCQFSQQDLFNIERNYCYDVRDRGFDIENIFHYFDTLRRQTGRGIEEIQDLYRIEQNPFKAVKYLQALEGFQVAKDELEHLHRLESNPDNIKKHAAHMRTLVAHGFSAVDAFLYDCTIEKHLIPEEDDKLHYEKSFRVALLFADKLLEAGVHPTLISVLFTLFPYQDLAALQEISSDKSAFPKQGTNEAEEFIRSIEEMRKDNVDAHEIAFLSRITFDPERARMVQKLDTVFHLKLHEIQEEDFHHLLSVADDCLEDPSRLEFLKLVYRQESERSVAYLVNQLKEFDSGILKSFKKYILPRFNLNKIPKIAKDNFNTFEFLQDPALSFCADVYKFLPEKDLSLALKIGRNFYLYRYLGNDYDLKIDASTVFQERVLLESYEKRMDDIKLFEGRNVVALRHRELLGEIGPESFGRSSHYFPIFSAIKERLASDKGEIGKFTRAILAEQRFFRSEEKNDLQKSIGPNGTLDVTELGDQIPTPEEINKVHDEILDKMRDTKPPMTFYFSGHGGPHGLYFNSGKVQQKPGEPQDFKDFISDEEMAAVLNERTQKFSNQKDLLAQDIYIFDGCFNHTFIRSVIQQNNGVQPIMIGPSEYGQPGFSIFAKSERSEYKILQFGKEGTTLGDVRRNEKSYHYSNYSIYMPNANNIPQQVTKSEVRDSKKNV